LTTARIELPPKLIPVFTGEADVRGAYGGRGSAKTRTFAKMSAVRAYMWDQMGREGIILCGRQFMNSLDDSSMEEVKAAIRSEPWLAPHFDIGEKYIRTVSGRVAYKFAGLDRHVDSVKSKARVLLCWVDEAEPVLETAWAKLIPTLREIDSELWVTWNPESDESATHKRFRQTDDPRAKVIELNWRDNPWFPDVLNRVRLKDEQQRPDTYDHVWEGGFKTLSDAIIMLARCSFEEFETPKDVGRFFFGADWGFARDPAVLLRAFMLGDDLFIDHEAFGIGVELDHLEERIFNERLVPGCRSWPISGDNSRPETIAFVQRRGFNISAAEKWPGRVEDGIAYLKGFKRIHIHPRCPNMAREARLYSYKIDRKTQAVLPIVVDAHNHGWDALRYALTGYIRSRSSSVKPLRI
jgi:phage terminase large subunit